MTHAPISALNNARKGSTFSLVEKIWEQDLGQSDARQFFKCGCIVTHSVIKCTCLDTHFVFHDSLTLSRNSRSPSFTFSRIFKVHKSFRCWNYFSSNGLAWCFRWGTIGDNLVQNWKCQWGKNVSVRKKFSKISWKTEQVSLLSK